jgi:hypothetical protein
VTSVLAVAANLLLLLLFRLRLRLRLLLHQNFTVRISLISWSIPSARLIFFQPPLA